MALSRQSRMALDATLRERQGPPEPGRSDFADSMGLAASEAAAAVAAHVAEVDPHTQYITAAELAAANIVSTETQAAASKTTPVDADEIPLLDSAASYVLKALLWVNVKATLKTYFDTLYEAVGGGGGTAGDAADTLYNLTLATSRSAGAETIALKTKAGTDPAGGDPITLSFRDAALTTGGYVVRTVTAANSITINSGATVGVELAATVTMTIASPCVVTYANHGLRPDDGVIFTTTGALPTGITAGVTYYVVADSGYTFSAFRVSTTVGGAAINTSGSQSGVHTCTQVPKPFRLWIVAADDAGTIRLGVIRCDTGANIVPLKNDLIVSSTAISAAADSSGVFYSGTAWASKPIRVLGYLDYSLAVAGTWDAAPTLVQLYGKGMKLPGDRVQLCRTTVEGFATTTTTYADALGEVPVNTYGAEFMTVTITPTSAVNRVRVSASAFVTTPANGWLPHGIWKDSETRARRAGRIYTATSAGMYNMNLTSDQIASAASSQTFRFRTGCTAAGTVTFNGISSAVQAGGKTGSFIEAEELMV